MICVWQQVTSACHWNMEEDLPFSTPLLLYLIGIIVKNENPAEFYFAINDISIILECVELKNDVKTRIDNRK